jgi:hypothetical protein
MALVYGAIDEGYNPRMVLVRSIVSPHPPLLFIEYGVDEFVILRF